MLAGNLEDFDAPSFVAQTDSATGCDEPTCVVKAETSLRGSVAADVVLTNPDATAPPGARANMTALRSFFARGEHPSPPMEVRAGKLAENVTMQRL